MAEGKESDTKESYAINAMKTVSINQDIGVVWRPSNGNWYIKGEGNKDWSKSLGNLTIQCGMNGDVPMLIDWYGDGRSRLTVFRPSNGNWYIKGVGIDNWGKSSNNMVVQCGISGDIPVPFDYFGEGKPRIAVWRPSNGNWYIKGASFDDWNKSTGNITIQCGIRGDIPIVADYFGEDKLRISVFRPSNGNWYIKGAGTTDWNKTSGNTVIQCGINGDIPMVKDYFGDGKMRLSVFRPRNGNWYIKGAGTNDWNKTSDNIVVQCGIKGDIPIPGNFFMEGKARIAVFRPSNGNWYIKGDGLKNWGDTKLGNIVIQFGINGDTPVLCKSTQKPQFNSLKQSMF